MNRIGLLGGSFDPVHLAHTALADTAYQTLGLDEFDLIPAANPWQRAPLAATAEQRLDMLKLAVAKRPYLRVNPLEIMRGGKTYTIDTLKELPQAAEYYWILGADQLGNFCSWHCWQEIARRTHLVVAQRPGAGLAAPEPLARHLACIGRRLIELPFQPMPVSASDIRRRLAAGLSIQGLVDVAVAQYIKQNKLYQPPLS